MDATALVRRRPVVLVVLGAVLLLLWLSWRTCGLSGCPDVASLISYQPGGGSVLLDRDGARLGEISPAEHAKVSLKDLPPHIAQAFLAVEDRRFYQHHGIDWRRAGGALFANLRASAFRQGFSTISMQLARNVFADDIPGAERTLGRKLLEIRVAGAIEDRFSKDEILELYLNHIYFGNGARGIVAAAQTYFARPPAELTLPQAAVLAAMIKAPTRYDPRRHPNAARQRRDLVLQLMAQQKRIDLAEAQRAQAAPLRTAARSLSSQPVHSAPYFVEEVRRQLEERLGEGIYRESLRVWTTLDRSVQRAAEQEIERQLRRVDRSATRPSATQAADGKPDGPQAALVVLSAHDGDVLAWVGGRDYGRSQFDRVRSARRQVGSAFKPFVYGAALGRGFSLSQMLLDEPLRVTQVGGGVWQPHNFKDDYDGIVTLREALTYSKNVATVRLANEVGHDAVAALARRAGIQSRIEDLPSMALGAAQISPLELTAAYTAFAAGGQAALPRVVLRVTRADGSVVWQSTPKRNRVLSPAAAFLVTDVLRDAVDHGTSRSVRDSGFTGPAAGKTGTTNDAADAWFVGYTPELVAGIWLGFDEPRPMAGRATGGQLAAPIWGNLMRRVYATRQAPEDWQPPEGIVRHSIDAETGRPLKAGCATLSEPQYEYFISGTEPAEYCPDEDGPATAAVIGSDKLTWKQRAPARPIEPVAVQPQPSAEQPVANDALPLPNTDQSEPAAPTRTGNVAKLGGDWEFTTRIQSTSYPRFMGLQLGYRVHFTQRGSRVFGSGRKWIENGRTLRPAARTPIEIEGTFEAGILKVRFVEHGTQRDSSGQIVWQMVAADRLEGNFASSVADSRGSCNGRRLGAPGARKARSRDSGQTRRNSFLDDVVKTPRTIARGIGRLFQ